jgi:anti-anti-sigma regulatory factor/PAS domain-containing protein
MTPLYSYLNLPIIVLVSMLLVYVVSQDPRATANRLFGWYIGVSLLLLISSLISQTSQVPHIVWTYGAIVAPLISLITLLLAWLIMALFLPERYAQPTARWLIGAPFLLATLLLIQAPLTGWLQPFVGLSYNEEGRLVFQTPAGLNPLLIAYIVSNLVLTIITAAIAIRHRNRRVPALMLLGGLILYQIIGSLPFSIRYPIFFSLASVPIYLAFTWITLRYQVFHASTDLLQRALDSLPDGVVLLNKDNQLQYANTAARNVIGFDAANTSRNFDELLAAVALVPDGEITSADRERTRYIRQGEQALVLESSESTVSDRLTTSRLLFLRDITRREEQARLLTQQNAEQQRLLELVALLETPTIVLTDQIVLAPIIGNLDANRAKAITSRLLEMVHARDVRTVILDVAGVTTMDTEVAQLLQSTIQALELLGCNVVLSGISAKVALTITRMGINLQSVQVVRSPQEILVSQQGSGAFAAGKAH